MSDNNNNNGSKTKMNKNTKLKLDYLDGTGCFEHTTFSELLSGEWREAGWLFDASNFDGLLKAGDSVTIFDKDDVCPMKVTRLN